MKKLLFSLILLQTITAVWAQAPQRMSYQSIIRDANNVVVASTAVGIKISILRGTATGPAVYVETHRKATNANGLVSLEIGEGTAITGTFAGIDWANGPYLIKTETDPSGGTNYSIPGIAALNSVPYALFSANGTPGPQGERGANGATGPTGASGATGPQGPIGLTGPIGLAGSNGAVGATGPQGPTGLTGPAGTNGLDGKTVLNGTSNPTSEGADGDFYINTTSNMIFGPKASGVWPNAGVSLVGPTGTAGTNGTNGLPGAAGINGVNGVAGTNGLDGKTVLNGTSNPTSEGVDGDFYINTTSNTIFGPKALGSWPAGVSLIGIASVGGISGTSTANGASITAGELKLAPADGINGGIVTTAAQTFAGAKTFSADLTVNAITIGRGAGNINDNIAIGSQALLSNTSGGGNTAIGMSALNLNTTGTRNTATGSNALKNNTEGANNTAYGRAALLLNTTGSNNTAVGFQAFGQNTAGSNNTAIGYGTSMVNGISNATAIGSGAIVAASNSIQLGNASVTNVNTSGTISAGAITYPNTVGTNGYVLTTDGIGTASWVTPAAGVSAVGAISGTSAANGASITSGVLNLAPADATNGGIVTTGVQTFAGAKTFSSDITVNGLTIGKGAGNVSTNTAAGISTLSSNTSGNRNTATGASALISNISGNRNTATGAYALFSNTLGSSNTATGLSALSDNEDGNYNTANGAEALYKNIDGDQNTANGYTALYNNRTGTYNTAAGSSTLYQNRTGTYNTAIGSSALYGNNDGTYNTATGAGAGRYIADGSTSNYTSDYSVYLGSGSKASADDAQNEIVIGYNAIGAGSNTVQLGNASVTNVKTNGVLSASGLVLKTVTLGPNAADNYDVSGVGILFLVPTSGNVVINGFSNGVIGQMLHLVVSNPPTSGSFGIELKHNSGSGTQKIVCGSDLLISYNKGVTLVFDGTYWRPI